MFLLIFFVILLSKSKRPMLEDEAVKCYCALEMCNEFEVEYDECYHRFEVLIKNYTYKCEELCLDISNIENHFTWYIKKVAERCDSKIADFLNLLYPFEPYVFFALGLSYLHDLENPLNETIAKIKWIIEA